MIWWSQEEENVGIVMSLMLSKSISMFHELSWLLMELASVLMSAIRFSSFSANFHSSNRRRHYPFSSFAAPTWYLYIQLFIFLSFFFTARIEFLVSFFFLVWLVLTMVCYLNFSNNILCLCWFILFAVSKQIIVDCSLSLSLSFFRVWVIVIES